MTRRAAKSLLILLALLTNFAPAATKAATASGAAFAAHAADEEPDARAAIEQAFERLRAGDYSGVYDALPTASQRRVSRARFVEGLGRARAMLTLDRLEIGRVRVAGDLAVIDTTLYATINQPVRSEGKIVSRQYLVREGGRWRVTTGDRSTVRPLLAANPSFARQFPPTEPRVYFKRDGRWVVIEALQPPRRKKS